MIHRTGRVPDLPINHRGEDKTRFLLFDASRKWFPASPFSSIEGHMKRRRRSKIVNSCRFYRIVKAKAQRRGFSELQSSIYGVLALEECLRKAGPMMKLKFLSTIVSYALPDLAKIEPASDAEAALKKEIMDFYGNPRDNSKINHHLAAWKQVDLDIDEDF